MRLRPRLSLVLLALSLPALLGTADAQRRARPKTPGAAPFSYAVDTTIRPREDARSLAGGRAGQRIATTLEPGDLRQDFVVDEILFKPRGPADLRSFLRTYDGRVVDDGAVPALPPELRPRRPAAAPAARTTGAVVVKIDLRRAPLARMAANARRLRVGGHFRFSSEDAARLSAVIMEERVRGRDLAIDLIFEPQTARRPCVAGNTFEHPLTASAPRQGLLNLGYLNGFSNIQWLNDPDIRVPEAWARMSKRGHAHRRVLLFVIDVGFSPNADFRAPTYQYNFGNNTYDATGPYQGGWHGTRVFSIAGAMLNNRYGNAGTGGQVVVPVLFATRMRRQEFARAVRTAIEWSQALRLPGVINMSFAGRCGFFCRMHGFDDALEEAAGKGLIPVAGAGNDNVDVEDKDVVPCKESGVICVGAIGTDKRRWPSSNRGSRVDIWAPGVDVVTTFDPSSNDAPGQPLLGSTGTSAASPFVAGVVAMMKAANPALTRDQARNILREEAVASPDPSVRPGYVNAFRSVLRADDGLPVRSTRFVGSGVKWHDFFGHREEVPAVGDFDGDCRDDIATFTKGAAGEVFVALSGGRDFVGTAQRWGLSMCVLNQVCAVGDFDGDGRDDIAIVDQENGTVRVARSSGGSFGPPAEWLTGFSRRRGQTVVVGNFGGPAGAQGRPLDDLAVLVHGNNPATLPPGETRGEVYVALSDGARFGPRARWHQFFAPGPEKVAAGDFNFDGRDDLVAFLQSCCPPPAAADVFVARSLGHAFAASTKWHDALSPGAEVPATGEFNGDGRFDALSFVRSSPTNAAGLVPVVVSNASRFNNDGFWHRGFCFGSEICRTGDFDGDGRTDVIAFTMGEAGDVFVALSSP